MTLTWYPVIYPDKCDGCQGSDKPKCVEFCPHDVFHVRDNRVVVANPQNCVEGCVACTQLCPRKAIDFPSHKGYRRSEKAWTEGLRKAVCKKCGKAFWTNEDKDLCWECESS